MSDVFLAMLCRAFLVLGLMATVAGCAATGAGSGPLQELATESDQSDAERRARVRLELASAYFSRGQLEVALDELKLSIGAKADLSEAYNLRGLVYAAMSQPTLAEGSFKRALQVQARDADAMHNYAWFLCQAQRYPEAMTLFDQALAEPQYRGGARSLMARGLCQARAGQWMQAEGSLLKSYELDPSYPGTAINLAEVLYRRAEFERARFYIGRVNSQPVSVNAQTLWLAARIERKLGGGAREREFGAQLRSKFPDAPETQLFEAGRFDE